MPRADFYLIAKPRFREQPLRLVCELARKAHDANLWTLVLARDAAQAEALDDMLWDMGDDVFIPHQIAGADDDEDEAAVLIAPPEVDAPLRPLVINLRDAAVEGSFERVRSEEHTSELQSLMRISYAVFCLKKKHTRDMRVLY